MTPDERLRSLAEMQHGLLTRRQIRSMGLSRSAVEHRIDRRALLPVTPTVVRLVGAPQSKPQRARAAVLEAGTGGCLSHDSASAHWGVPGYRLEPLNVWRVRDRSSHPNRVGVQHKSRRLPDRHVVLLDAVPVTSPTRTIFGLASVLPLGKTARVLDNLWVRRLTSHRRLQIMFEELRGRGRTGIKTMRILLAERGDGYRPPESNLERRFQKLAFDSNVGGFERQVDIWGPDGWIGRADFVHKTLPLIVEVDGERFHTALIDRDADRARDQRLRAAGYRVERITEFEIWYRPHGMLTRIRRALDELGAVSRPLACRTDPRTGRS